MARAMRLLSTVALLSIAPIVFAQDFQSQPKPLLPSDVLGRQLIVWSDSQEPHPLPQPLPDQQPERPDKKKPSPPPTNPPNEQPSATRTRKTSRL